MTCAQFFFKAIAYDTNQLPENVLIHFKLIIASYTPEDLAELFVGNRSRLIFV